MFAYVRKVFGAISIREEQGLVHVEGVPSYLIQSDIRKLWGTSKIGNNIFTSVDGSSFSFYSFFALEVDYAINRLLDDKATRCSRNTLRKISAALREQTWLAKVYDENLRPKVVLNQSKLRMFKKTPLDYQTRFFNEFADAVNRLQLKGYVLAGTPGSGKTLMGLCLGEQLEVDHIVVICPKNSMDTVWAFSARAEYKNPQTSWVAYHGKPFKGERVVVFHYEALDQALVMVKAMSNKKLLVIVDESHNLTSETSARTVKFTRMCQDLRNAYVIWASGTPFKAIGAESVPILQSIDPMFNQDVADVFRKIYGKDAKTGLDILNHRINWVMTIIEKKELGLVPPTIKNLMVHMPNAERYTLESIAKVMAAFIADRKVYYASRKEQDEALFRNALRAYEDTIHGDTSKHGAYQKYLVFLNAIIASRRTGDVSEEIVYCNRFENEEIIPSLSKDYKEDFKEVRAIIKYVDLKIRGECLGRVLGKIRIECVVDMVNHIDFVDITESTEKKTVIFTSYVEPLEAAEKLLKASKLKPLTVYADTNANLNQIIEKFRTDPDANPMVATFNSLSTAVPLVMADTMLMLNVPFRAYVYDQAIARIDRLGQDSPTTVWIACLDTGTKPNISSRTVDILTWSQSQVEAILGISSAYDLKDQSVSLENQRQLNLGLEAYLPMEDYQPK